jgi:endonuclease/exonuclease/phosphatase family metal-dependent hydrolase
MQALMAVIAAADADIVCLQEVTYKTRDILLQDSFIN